MAESISRQRFRSPSYCHAFFHPIALVLYVILIDWSFSLINVFPARVFKWVDGLGDDLGAQTVTTVRAVGAGGAYQGGAAAGGLLSQSGNIGFANKRAQPRRIANKTSKD